MFSNKRISKLGTNANTHNKNDLINIDPKRLTDWKVDMSEGKVLPFRRLHSLVVVDHP